jgi:hypothetical protein
MKGPINDIDYARFLKLAELIRNRGKGEINIYADGLGSYVHVEISGHGIPPGEVQSIFSLPIQSLIEELMREKEGE